MRRVSLTISFTLMAALISAGPARSGDVVVSLEHGLFDDILTIVGDNQANEIRITEDAPDHVRIEGANGTTVNGLPSIELFTTQPAEIGYASINLGNGDDVVEYVFTGDRSNHLTDFTTGHGGDQVTVRTSGPSVGGKVTIDTGTGSDTVTMQLGGDTWMYGFDINTGVGDDAVFIEADNSTGGIPILEWWSQIETEGGNDSVQFEGYFDLWFGSMFMLLGDGDDILVGDSDSIDLLNEVTARGGSGDDTVLNASYFRDEVYEFETIVE